MPDSFIETGVEIAVGIMVILLLGAYLLPVAISAWFNTTADTGNGTASNWTGPVVDLWDILPLLAIVGLLLFFVGYAIYSAFDRFG